MESARKIPTLLDMCIQLAIDNVRYIGDVGETDSRLLEIILPHCTVDQLSHIEKSTEDRDLSPVTDKLWKKFYERQFGSDSVDLVVKRMKQKQVVFKWMQLYEAKTKERELAQKKSVDRLKQLYAKEEDKKRSRQVRICSKIPPSSNKRSFYGGSGYDLSNIKSNIMKKAKLDYLNSHELKVHATIRKNTLQRQSLRPQSVSQPNKPGSSSGRTFSISQPNKLGSSSGSSSSSASKLAKPLARR